MKIFSIMKFTLLMQVPGWLDAGLNGLMQVLGCSDAGPLKFKDGNTAGESMSTFGKNHVIG